MKKELGLFIMLLVLILAGCSTTTITYENGEKEFWDKFVVVEEYDNPDNGTLYMVYDKDTKVEYYIVNEGHRYGLCPVYDTDGTVKVYGEGE